VGDRYPPIADYGFIGDGHSAALVSRSGSIDWCCMARMDFESCFGRLLDWERGGECVVAPEGEGWSVRRRYVECSLVLETTFSGPAGEVRLLDFFSMRAGGRERPHNQLVRIVEGVRGDVPLRVRVRPMFEYGMLEPWMRGHGDGLFSAIGGDLALVLWSDLPLELDGRTAVSGTAVIRAGERRRLSLRSVRSHRIYPGRPRRETAERIDQRLGRTLAWWRHWASQADGIPRDHPALRSAAVIKGLTNAPTGAIAAAATTSLPERIGGSRNWDYRFSWIRDSTFALRSLGALGFHKEAHGFRAFIERSTAGSPAQLQVAYGFGGEHRLTEILLDHLEGWRGSRPVRIGNAAWKQRQLDLYGDILDLAWASARAGGRPSADYWHFLRGVVDRVVDVWHLPDRGIWEIRGRARHFVYSKAMCWSALDRGLRLADLVEDATAPRDRWREAREAIRAAIETHGYDAKRGVFVQSFGDPALDASLLLLPRTGFVTHADPRMMRTVDAIRAELITPAGLVRRYDTAQLDDGMSGDEGCFLACSFWLVECLACQGRRDEARRLFDHVSSLANDLGLFSEEYDPHGREMLGNFPQGLTHYSHIAAAMALERGALETS
jgi:GH15 family glucan-1,4-alpha-glucosidase